MIAHLWLCLRAPTVLWQLIKRGCQRQKELLAALRLPTGVFAAGFVLVGFKFYPMAWLAATITALTFAGITFGIMMFNDFIDRHHDVKKGKTFAQNHPWQMLTWWARLSLVTLGGIAAIGFLDFRLALFCGLVWIVGLLYSYVPHWYVVQNLIVATCSASAVLGGAIHSQSIRPATILAFLIILGIIFFREVVKDIEDRLIDGGYKNTIPVKTASWAKPDEHIYTRWKGSVPRQIYERWQEGFPPIKTELLTTAKITGTIVCYTAMLIVFPLEWAGLPASFLLAMAGGSSYLWLQEPKAIVLTKQLIDATLLALFVAFIFTAP